MRTKTFVNNWKGSRKRKQSANIAAVNADEAFSKKLANTDDVANFCKAKIISLSESPFSDVPSTVEEMELIAENWGC